MIWDLENFIAPSLKTARTNHYYGIKIFRIIRFEDGQASVSLHFTDFQTHCLMNQRISIIDSHRHTNLV